MSEEISKFMLCSLIPSKLHHVYSKTTIWTMKDVKHRHLLATSGYSKLFGCFSRQELIGKTLLEVANPALANIQQTHKQEKQVLRARHSRRDVLCVNGDEFVSLYAVTTTPIFYRRELIALDKKFTLISKYDFDRFSSISSLSSPSKLVVETEQEKYVLSLLILHKTQQQIASYLSLSRSRIVQIITKLCAQFGIDGCSSYLLVSRALAANFHQQIPPEIYMLAL